MNCSWRQPNVDVSTATSLDGNTNTLLQLGDANESWNNTAKSQEETVKAVEAVFDRYHLIAASKNHNGFDSHLMINLKIIDLFGSGSGWNHSTNPCGSNSVWKGNGNASWYHD
ncbi:hypothetical protein EYC80_008006 [Monilinia laxa]|uniref:Uncharacterized protein n=1 Tax=Monilinia laxa TaxID=61186 RepID=A0A5N6JVG8_MONLA|nr:hypothetical protein EYC80_008006 [Monilinia laxa]